MRQQPIPSFKPSTSCTRPWCKKISTSISFPPKKSSCSKTPAPPSPSCKIRLEIFLEVLNFKLAISKIFESYERGTKISRWTKLFYNNVRFFGSNSNISMNFTCSFIFLFLELEFSYFGSWNLNVWTRSQN